MNNDYYSLKNGKSAIDYIYKFNLLFARGNVFKYLTRASTRSHGSEQSGLPVHSIAVYKSKNQWYNSFINWMELAMNPSNLI